jgi:transaldolase
MNPLNTLHDAGQSVWLDNIRRELLTTGTLARYIEELAVTGLTSNPTIFEQAIAGSDAYDEAIRSRSRDSSSTESLFFGLAIDDLGQAADLFCPIYEQTGGVDGYVSLEVSPTLADDTEGTIAQARALFTQANRPNLMIKVPGTQAGLVAVEELIFDGIPVNVTLLFSREHALEAARAYQRGIARRVEAGLEPHVASVASVFVSRWDGKTKDLPENLKNRVGISVMQTIYRAYREFYAEAEWKTLARAGAHPQRLLWASTGTKDESLASGYYLTELAAADTVTTVPEGTLTTFAESGDVQGLMGTDTSSAEALLADVGAAGFDLDQLAQELQQDGADKFVASWMVLMSCIEDKARALRAA